MVSGQAAAVTRFIADALRVCWGMAGWAANECANVSHRFEMFHLLRADEKVISTNVRFCFGLFSRRPG
jgi:hypothetical protein